MILHARLPGPDSSRQQTSRVAGSLWHLLGNWQDTNSARVPHVLLWKIRGGAGPPADPELATDGSGRALLAQTGKQCCNIQSLIGPKATSQRRKEGSVSGRLLVAMNTSRGGSSNRAAHAARQLRRVRRSQRQQTGPKIWLPNQQTATTPPPTKMGHQHDSLPRAVQFACPYSGIHSGPIRMSSRRPLAHRGRVLVQVPPFTLGTLPISKTLL